jgi:hypothetical protein
MVTILSKIKNQESARWFLAEEHHNRLIYRTHYISDPFAAMEIVLKRGQTNKAYVLYKSEENPTGMELFFQKEIHTDDYLSIAENMSEMFYEFIC